MKTYLIPEVNMPKLETALKRIRNKCIKYNCAFTYTVGEAVFIPKMTESGTEIIKYIKVTAEGTALAESGWRIVAITTHRSAGNVIRQFDFSVSIPERFMHTDSICEHCNTNRRRAETCILYKEESQEWKQVGKTCLKDFTGALSVEHAAAVASVLDTLERAESSPVSGAGKKYYPVEDILLYGAECIRHWRYERASEPYPTGCRALHYYLVFEQGSEKTKEDIRDLSSVKFQPCTDDNKKTVESAVSWILSEDTETDIYLSNLKTIVKSGYILSREAVFLVSLLQTYKNHLIQEQKAKDLAARREQERRSSHVGSVGDKLEVKIASASLITDWTNQYGWSGMYKFVSVDGNIFIWITGKGIELDKVASLTGTVKSHDVYDGVNQTHLTRCKVTYADEAKEPHPEDGTLDIDGIFEMLEG